MNIVEKLSKIPRQIIFLVMAAAIIIPLITPIGMPVNEMPKTRKLFEAIESLTIESKPILVSCDFDPQSMPELYPMLQAVLSHCFTKNIKVLVMALWPQGAGMGEMALDTLSKVFNKKNGEDYVFLGYKVGGAAVILGLGDKIKNVFPMDYYNKSLDSLILTQNLVNFNDISLIVSLSAGDPGYRTWLYYGQSKYGVRVGTGVTAVSAADAYPYLDSGQLVGLFAGMKGAAEYETILNRYKYRLIDRLATKAMDPQSFGHLVIMLFIIIGNVSFFMLGRKK